jgi:CRISPR-associated protein Csm1
MKAFYVAGEFYGIQKYVLGITAAGGGQAKRLRARSFVVQVLEDIAVAEIDALGPSTVVMGGGGQFVLEVENSEREEALRSFRKDLQRRLFEELGGELSFNLGWADSIEGALRERALERRRPWAGIMIGPEGWLHKQMRFDDISPPCEVCRKRRARKMWESDGTPDVCERCDTDRRIGELIPRVQGVELSERDAEARLLGRGIRFRHANEGERAGLPGRLMYRYVPVRQDGSLATFEEIAEQAQGDELLGILKADVDDFGKLIAAHMQMDKLDELRAISAHLDDFFSGTVQRMIREGTEWSSIYTVFSGGDDLLLVGPWSVMLDFAATVEDAFSAGPGRQYRLTLSAGVSFMPPRIPIRHGVRRAEEQLKQAKRGKKNQCATLGGIWSWEALRRVLGGGRQLVKWQRWEAAKRGLLRRLHRLASSSEPTGHLWAWELGRNFPKPNAKQEEHKLFREWGKRVLANWDKDSMKETRAALLYALTATRIRSKDERRDQPAGHDRRHLGR